MSDAVIALTIAFLIPLIDSVLSSSITSGLLIGVGGTVGAAVGASTVGGGAVKTLQKIVNNNVLKNENKFFQS